MLANARHAAPLLLRRDPQGAHVVLVDNGVVGVPQLLVLVGVTGEEHAGQGAVRQMRPGERAREKKAGPICLLLEVTPADVARGEIDVPGVN